MKALVIGAGMMGSAAASDLAHSPGVGQVMLADIDGERARTVAAAIDPGVEALTLDVSCYDDVVAAMKRANIVIGATTYSHNLLLTRAAIEARVHFCDLGGNMDVVAQQRMLSKQAQENDVCILPNCGLAPGLACVVAAGAAQRFERVDVVQLRVGGLPQHPRPPLKYQLVFSPEGLINEYIEPAEAIRKGVVTQVESMTDIEHLTFPPPFGELEAFNTSGGVSTLPEMFKGKVRSLDYKTIRYKGHCEKFKLLLDLGFGSAEPMVVGNTMRTAREVFQELLRRKLPTAGPDVVLMRVTVEGILDNSHKKLAYDMIDYYDEKAKMTAMMRTTAFPTSIMAQMIGTGAISVRGVFPPEQCVPLEPLLQELKKRNIVLKETLTKFQ